MHKEIQEIIASLPQSLIEETAIVRSQIVDACEAYIGKGEKYRRQIEKVEL